MVSEVNRRRSTATRAYRGPELFDDELMVALKQIYDAAGIDRLNVRTYQSVSGTGVKAVKELEDQTRARSPASRFRTPRSTRTTSRSTAGRRRELPRGRRPHRRRRKMMFETRKILGDESIKVAVNCARVPCVARTRSR